MNLDAVGGAAGAWLIAALLLGVAELAIPGVFLVFLAIAAAITGAVTYALPDLSTAAQLGAFAVWSAVSVLIGRRWYSDYAPEAADPLLNDRVTRMIGRTVTVETAIRNGHGRVTVGDGSWPAQGADAEVGMAVRIVAIRNGVVEVASLSVDQRSD